jgi:TrmH family RNA methyltransferase
MIKRLRSYKPDLPHSYALGVSPTIELLAHRLQEATEVVVGTTWERNSGIHKIMRTCAERGIEVIVSDRTLNRIARRTDCWAVGVFRKYQADLDPEADHVVLVNPNDMGNVGTVVRTMLACGVADLAVVRPACDLFDPRVVRASMGAFFQMRHAHFGSFGEYLQQFPRESYCFMPDAGQDLPGVQFCRPFALVFGSEGEGLPEEYRAVGTSVRIPQTDAVDSLNLAVSVGIALYAVGRQD